MPLDTELHKSAHKGDFRGVKEYVESGEIHVNEPGAQNRTAIHRAAGANHVDIIKYLLQAGAPVDCVDRCLRTPLHWAAISGHLHATQLLLENGGDLRLQTVSGMNPLMCAVQQGWPAVVDAILDWVALPLEEDGNEGPSAMELCAATDAEGKTALVFAKENGDKPMIKVLKTYEPKPNASSCCGASGNKAQALSAVVVTPQQQQGPSSSSRGATAPDTAELSRSGRENEEKRKGAGNGRRIEGERTQEATDASERHRDASETIPEAAGGCCIPFGRCRGQPPPPRPDHNGSLGTMESSGDAPSGAAGSATAQPPANNNTNSGDSGARKTGDNHPGRSAVGENGRGHGVGAGTSDVFAYDGRSGGGVDKSTDGSKTHLGSGAYGGPPGTDGLSHASAEDSGVSNSVTESSFVASSSAYSDSVGSDFVGAGGSESGQLARELKLQQMVRSQQLLQERMGADVSGESNGVCGMRAVGEERSVGTGGVESERGDGSMRRSRSSRSNHHHSHRSRENGDGTRKPRRRRTADGETHAASGEGGTSAERRSSRSRGSGLQRHGSRSRSKGRRSRDGRHGRHGDRPARATAYSKESGRLSHDMARVAI